MKRADSILPGGNEYECYRCGRTDHLHLHHIFFGQKNRTLSDRYGCWCYLCYECHEGTFGVHGKYGHDRDATLKSLAQRSWEAVYGTRAEFREIFGKSYVYDDETPENSTERGCDG